MSRIKQNSVTAANKHLNLINLEEHIDFWDEAKNSIKHYFLNAMDIDITHITNWLTNNSKYYYDVSDNNGLKELYTDMCLTLLEIRDKFNYEKIGKIIKFLISDNRFYIKPYDFPKRLKEIYDDYIFLSKQWDEVVLIQFAFPYKTILTLRYEVQSFLLYICLEGCAQKLVQSQSSINLLNVMKTLLDCLELPMSLYVDSFHLRKLLYQISLKCSPAFSLQCVHPIITQLQYIFQLYYKNIHSAWLKIEVLDKIPVTMLGFSYVIQNFLVDNFNSMVFWKSSDYKSNLEQHIKPMIVSMFELSMPLEIINKLLVQGFYDIINDDCSGNFVRNQFDTLLKDLDQWKQLTQAWNEGVPFEQFHIAKSENVYLENLMAVLYNRGIVDWDHSYFCMNLIHNFLFDRLREPDHISILLKYFCTNSWSVDETLHVQIQNWFQHYLDSYIDLGSTDEDTTNQAIKEIENYLHTE